MKISCAALLEKSYFNYLLGCKQRAAACASRFLGARTGRRCGSVYIRWDKVL